MLFNDMSDFLLNEIASKHLFVVWFCNTIVGDRNLHWML